ncbi:MAG: MBL fold metallo-hydrolase [Bacillota bacterium]
MLFRPVKTGKVLEKVYAVKVKMVNFFVYTDGESTICIDSGFKMNTTLRELKKINIDPKSVSHIFLTHSDIDHAGGIGLFKNAKIYLSADEEQMINGTTPRNLCFIYNKRIDRDYTLLMDNDIVNVGAIKVRAIATPGHTPGSMSYLVDDSILFTGDMISLRKNRVTSLFRYVNMNNKKHNASKMKLKEIENISAVCTAHSGYSDRLNL